MHAASASVAYNCLCCLQLLLHPQFAQVCYTADTSLRLFLHAFSALFVKPTTPYKAMQVAELYKSGTTRNLQKSRGCAGLTEGEKEEKARAKEALHSDGEGSEDEGDTRKAATYGNKKNEVCAVVRACLPLLHRWTRQYFGTSSAAAAAGSSMCLKLVTWLFVPNSYCVMAHTHTRP